MHMHPRALEYPESSLDRMITNESELSARVKIEAAAFVGALVGFAVVVVAYPRAPDRMAVRSSSLTEGSAR